jgi:DNA-binding CsgD family transcriptional regulator/tetratricopeptide (TPR) repeat protein
VIIVGVIGRVSSPQFVGRRAELAALEAALARAQEGFGSVVLVAGEAGMGKSRLISELAGRAQGNGMTVAVGECLPLGEGELPYAPVVGALRSLVRQGAAPELDVFLGPAGEDLATLPPELSLIDGDAGPPFSGEGSQGRLFEQLLTLLATAARAAPLVLVMEDFQWADRSTRDFLAFLVRAARREPIALIVSYRSDELQRRHPLRPFVLELERSGRAVRVELGKFTRAELSEQVAAILDAPPPPPLVDRLLARSGGNPFFTEELLASSHKPGEPLPASLRDTLLARVDAHSTSVRDLLRIAAVTGRTVDHALLAAVAQLPEDDLNTALRDAVDDYLLAHDPATAGYAFRHALLREAIYADLLPGERRTLHLRLARTLGERPRLAGTTAAAAAELAHHWYAAGELPAALVASVDAGAAAEDVHALGEAWLHYERALEMWELVRPAPAELRFGHLEVMRRAGEAAVLTGETQRAIALAREVLGRIDERSDSIQAALAHERLGRYLWTAGCGEDALPEYRRAVELMPEDPSEDRALVLAAEGQVLMLCNRHAESSDRCEQALTIARAVGAESVEAHVLNTICGNLSGVGDYDKAVAAAIQALGIARRLRLPGEMSRSYANGSDALDEAGRTEESIAMAREGISSAREFGIDRNIGDFLRGEVAGRLFRSGRWGEADQLLEEVMARGPTGVNAGVACLHLGELLAERGEFDAARRALDQADGQVTGSVGAMWLGPPVAARASLELWTGHPGTAAVLVADYLQRTAVGQPVFFSARVYELGTRACADLAALAPGDVNTCQQQAAHAQALLARLDELIAQLTAMAPPLVSASRAACAAECSRIGQPGDAVLWADAQRQWEACPNRYGAAYARWRGAEALLATDGDRRAAETLMREAHAVATELGARPLGEELERLALRARIDLGDQRTVEATPDARLERLELTPRELEVFALLTAGLTNREIAAELFISHKTASVHVSRILSKLSVPNRAAAAAAGSALGVKRARVPFKATS